MKNIARTIDHTNIDKKATKEDIIKTCQEAKEYNFRGVDVNPEWTGLVAEQLKGTKIKVIILIDPPMGLSSHEERINQVKRAKKDGADEVDVVMNIIDLKYERYNDVLNDLSRISKILPTKVIIGSGYLTDEEVRKASELVKESGAICVKTATEKDPLDKLELREKAKHVRIMKDAAPGLLIKASGKISSLKSAKMMIEEGADIIGTSSGVSIMKELKK